MAKSGQSPAMPAITIEGKDYWKKEVYHPGMSKRLYLAGMAMQGLCALQNKGTFNSIEEGVSKLVSLSLKYADELLKQESENP